MKIAVVIVTYNGSKWLQKCMDSLVGSSIKSKVFFIDNNSSDDTLDLIKTYNGDFDLVSLQVNIGFGQANNIGLKKALEDGFDCFLLLNQDAYLHSECLKNLSDFMCENDSYGIISPIHLSGDDSNLDNGFLQHLLKHDAQIITNDFFLRNKKASYDVSFINAACWLVSKECLRKIGGFDPIFYHYGEDDNYIQRMKYFGLKLGLLTTSFVNHDRRQLADYSLSREIEMSYRLALVKLCDVNLNFDEQFALLVKEMSKAICQNLFSFKWGMLYKRLGVLKKLIDAKSQILDSRLQNSKNSDYRYLGIDA